MTRILAALAAFALLATPALAQSTGHWASGVDCQPNVTGSTLTTDAQGNVTGNAGTPGYDCILTPNLMQPQWAQYQVAPPLTRVWGGDSPDAPVATVQLQFTDQAAALKVLTGLWVSDD